MDDFYSTEDPYTYPGSSILRNKLGLTEQEILDGHERLFVVARLMQTEKPPTTFDYTHFRALHFHMFQDVYDWAGQERTVFIRKGDSFFGHPLHIRDNGVRLLRELRTSLKENQHSFAALPSILSHFVNEMNALHPFREGNGRHLREFLFQVVAEMGCGFKAAALERNLWIEASIAGFNGNEGPMAVLLAEMLITPTTRREDMFELADLSAKRRARLCAWLRRSGYPADILIEYFATLGC